MEFGAPLRREVSFFNSVFASCHLTCSLWSVVLRKIKLMGNENVFGSSLERATLCRLLQRGGTRAGARLVSRWVPSVHGAALVLELSSQCFLSRLLE